MFSKGIESPFTLPLHRHVVSFPELNRLSAADEGPLSLTVQTELHQNLANSQHLFLYSISYLDECRLRHC